MRKRQYTCSRCLDTCRCGAKAGSTDYGYGFILWPIMVIGGGILWVVREIAKIPLGDWEVAGGGIGVLLIVIYLVMLSSLPPEPPSRPAPPRHVPSRQPVPLPDLRKSGEFTGEW